MNTPLPDLNRAKSGCFNHFYALCSGLGGWFLALRAPLEFPLSSNCERDARGWPHITAARRDNYSTHTHHIYSMHTKTAHADRLGLSCYTSLNWEMNPG